MAVQFINDGVPIRYSLGRGIGSMAYAVVCVLLGVQVRKAGLESTLLTHLILVGIEVVLVASYPAWRGDRRLAGQAGPRPQSVLSLLKSNPRFTLMLAGVLLGLTGIMPLSNFLVNIVTSRGGTEADLGLALFLMGGAELPTAWFFGRLLRRLGSGRLVMLSILFGTLKGVLLLLTTSFLGVLLVQPIQVLGYGLFTPRVGVLCQ